MGSVRDFRPVLFVVGILLITLSLAMALPAIADAVTGNPHWRVFLAASVFTLFIGTCLVLSNRMREPRLTVRQAFVLTTLSWVIVAAFAALPFAFSDLNLSYTDGYFEAMSGLTTTGSTVIVGLDDAPAGILLWRALLQWLGGIGIIVTAIAILPMLRVGGMQLFHTESSDSSEKVLPRAAQLAGAIGMVYLGLTISNGIAYWAAGMTPFEAVCHAMTTIATGGFSTSDRSLGHFNNDAIEGIATVYMVLGSLPFVLYLQAVRGGWGALARDTQVRWFFGLILFALLSLAGWLMAANGAAPTDAFREAAFNGISILTGTGYSTADFLSLGHLRASRLHAPHVYRRLYRLDHGRGEGLPDSGSRVHVAVADPPAHPAPRRLHQQVQQASDPGKRVAGGNGVLLPVHGQLWADRHGAGADGPSTT